MKKSLTQRAMTLYMNSIGERKNKNSSTWIVDEKEIEVIILDDIRVSFNHADNIFPHVKFFVSAKDSKFSNNMFGYSKEDLEILIYKIRNNWK